MGSINQRANLHSPIHRMPKPRSLLMHRPQSHQTPSNSGRSTMQMWQNKAKHISFRFSAFFRVHPLLQSAKTIRQPRPRPNGPGRTSRRGAYSSTRTGDSPTNRELELSNKETTCHQRHLGSTPGQMFGHQH